MSRVQCPVCGRLAVPFEVRSAWCRACTESMLVEQDRDARSFRQDPEVIVPDDDLLFVGRSPFVDMRE